MIKAFLIVLLVVFAVLGLSELIHGIKLKMLQPENKGITYLLLLPDRGHAWEQIYFLRAKLEWNGEIKTTCIIVCSDALEEKEIRRCKRLSHKNDIVFCGIGDLANIIGQTNEG